MPVSYYLIFAALLPLAGFAALIFFGKRFAGLAGPFATTLILGSLAASVTALVVWVAKPEFNQPHYVEAFTYRWLSLPAEAMASRPDAPPQPFLEAPAPVAAPAVTVGFFIDSLTIALFVLVTLIASLVHLFSISYMAGDPRLPRYFAYLGLFSFSMLALLLSNSLVQLFAFWQLLGISAALLTGFWFERRGPATAALASIIVNHLGDAAFLIGIGILVYHVGAGGLTFYDAQGTSPLTDSVRNVLDVRSTEFLYFTGAGPHAFLGLHWLTWAGLLFFAGAAAKAAQFPLHIWLPAASEGPPPVAAMIQTAAHAAAGVYLIARIYPILTMDARLAIAIIGCITLLLGALIALVQTDIRKLLAYSTISQLGYIMLFLGTGGYTAGLLHLFTHAFFKAGLLLSAASVLHALQHQSDLRQMGGLWRKLPLTAIAFGLCAFALVGVPFFSGAYSLQLGLAGAYEYALALAPNHHPRAALLLFYIPALTAFITAFYMARCWWLIFGGQSRNEELHEQAHESFLIVLPIAILATLSVNLYELFGLPMINRSLPSASTGGPPIIRPDQHLDMAQQLLWSRPGAWVFWAFLAAIPAVLLYYRGFALAERLRRLPVLNLLYFGLREKLFFDALYNGMIIGTALLVSRIAAFLDRYLLDGVAHFIILLARALSRLAAAIDRRILDGAVTGITQAATLANKALIRRTPPP